MKTGQRVEVNGTQNAGGSPEEQEGAKKLVLSLTPVPLLGVLVSPVYGKTERLNACPGAL